jgi:hypothetical protein
MRRRIHACHMRRRIHAVSTLCNRLDDTSKSRVVEAIEVKETYYRGKRDLL